MKILWRNVRYSLGRGLLTGMILTTRVNARILIETNSTWRYFKGTSEASDPTNAWREIDFEDSTWLEGNAPFHYGTNVLGGDDNITGGTPELPGRKVNKEKVVNHGWPSAAQPQPNRFLLTANGRQLTRMTWPLYWRPFAWIRGFGTKIFSRNEDSLILFHGFHGGRGEVSAWRFSVSCFILANFHARFAGIRLRLATARQAPFPTETLLF